MQGNYGNKRHRDAKDNTVQYRAGTVWLNGEGVGNSGNYFNWPPSPSPGSTVKDGGENTG